MIVVNLYQTKRYDVYGGRPTKRRPPEDMRPGIDVGWLGNPFKLGDESKREEVLAQFKVYFWTRLNNDNTFLRAVLALHDKTVACFCKPRSCHLDVVAAFIEWVATEEGQAWLDRVDPLPNMSYPDLAKMLKEDKAQGW